MNSDKKLLIKNNLENIINNIRDSSIELENKKIELSRNILLDYYNLITKIISTKPLTIYLLHLISCEINNSSSLIEKELLLTLLPEFYVPFVNVDISLTYPYLSRILTTIQSNILSEISPIFIGEIYKRIIIHIFNEDEESYRESTNQNIFEICQGFCLYNMKQNQFNYQLSGIICLNVLLNEIDYSFLNINNYISYIWEKIDLFLRWDKFSPKDYLLKYLCDLITKFKIQFKPYINLVIYKILGFIDNKNVNIIKNVLNVLSLLISFYPDEIKPIRSSITQLLTILQNDNNIIIRDKSIDILNIIDRQYNSVNKPITSRMNNLRKQDFFLLELDDKITKSKKNDDSNTNRILNKRMVTRKPINATNLNIRNNSTTKRMGGVIDLSQNSMRRNEKYFNRNKNNNENNIFKKKENYSVNKYDKKNNNNYIDKEIGFRDLLDSLKQVRKIKSEKVIKTV